MVTFFPGLALMLHLYSRSVEKYSRSEVLGGSIFYLRYHPEFLLLGKNLVSFLKCRDQRSLLQAPFPWGNVVPVCSPENPAPNISSQGKATLRVFAGGRLKRRSLPVPSKDDVVRTRFLFSRSMLLRHWPKFTNEQKIWREVPKWINIERRSSVNPFCGLAMADTADFLEHDFTVREIAQ